MRKLQLITVIALLISSPLFAVDHLAGNAIEFDGNGDYVSMASLIGNPVTGTIMVWAYTNSYDTGYNQLNLIFGQGDNLQLGLGDSSLSADGKWVFRLNDGGFKNAIGPLVTLDRWTHVAATWDGTNIILYLDGNEATRLTAGSPKSASAGIRFGAHPFANQNYWDGLLDEISVWNIALSQAQIQEKMHTTLGSEFYGDPASGLILYLPCNEDPGSPIAFDLTSTNNNGTLSGNADFVSSSAPLNLIFADGYE